MQRAGGKSPRLDTNVITASEGRKNSGFFRPDVLFNGHVFELAGLKDIATFLAFNKFNVFFAGHNPHTRVPAEFLHNCLFGRSFGAG